MLFVFQVLSPVSTYMPPLNVPVKFSGRGKYLVGMSAPTGKDEPYYCDVV